MTGTELLVIGGGLVLGWIVVSKLMAGSQPSAGSANDDPDAGWADILGVAGDSDPEIIRAAYDARLAQLGRSKPAMMTQPEMEAQTRARARLDNAYREGLAAHRSG